MRAPPAPSAMGRSGLVGAATVLLLLLAAVLVLLPAGGAARLLGGPPPEPPADTVDAAAHPTRGLGPRASTDQADRMIRDIEAMGTVYP